MPNIITTPYFIYSRGLAGEGRTMRQQSELKESLLEKHGFFEAVGPETTLLLALELDWRLDRLSRAIDPTYGWGDGHGLLNP